MSEISSSKQISCTSDMHLTYASIGQRGAMNDTSMLYHARAGSPSSVVQRVNIFFVNLVGVIYSISNMHIIFVLFR
jgi:hypothetical protein